MKSRRFESAEQFAAAAHLGRKLHVGLAAAFVDEVLARAEVACSRAPSRWPSRPVCSGAQGVGGGCRRSGSGGGCGSAPCGSGPPVPRRKPCPRDPRGGRSCGRSSRGWRRCRCTCRLRGPVSASGRRIRWQGRNARCRAAARGRTAGSRRAGSLLTAGCGREFYGSGFSRLEQWLWAARTGRGRMCGSMYFRDHS